MSGVEPGARAPFERTEEEIAASVNAFDVTISPMQIRTWCAIRCRMHAAHQHAQELLLPPLLSEHALRPLFLPMRP